MDDNNTHEVNVFHNGSLTPLTFQTIRGNQKDSGIGSRLGMGLSSSTWFSVYDIDLLACKEGVFVPRLKQVTLAGDYNDDNKVGATDWVEWRENQGTSNVLPNNRIGGMIGSSHYDQPLLCQLKRTSDSAQARGKRQTSQ